MTDYKYTCDWRKGRERDADNAGTLQAVLMVVVMLLVYGFVGYLEQTPDTTSPQAVLEDRQYVRDVLALESAAQDARDRVYIAEMVRIGRGER